MFTMAECQLHTLNYVKELILAVNKLSKPSDPTSDDAKKGEKKSSKKDDDDEDERREKGFENKQGERRNKDHAGTQKTTSPPPTSKSNQPSQSRSRHHSLRPRQSYGSKSDYIFQGLTHKEKKNLRQRLMRDSSVTLDASGNFLKYKEYEQGSGKRFEGRNMPTWLKKKDNYTRQEYQRKKNAEINRANEILRSEQEEAKKEREQELIYFQEMQEKIKDVTSVGKDADSSAKYNAMFKIHEESGKNYVEGMNSIELVSWWNLNIIPGRNALEGYNNYMNYNLSEKYAELARTNPVRTFRSLINNDLDIQKMLNDQKAKEDKERKEAASQKHKF